MVVVVVQLLLKCYVFIYVFFIVCVNQWYKLCLTENYMVVTRMRG